MLSNRDAQAQVSAARDRPRLRGDPSWPPKLPNNWVLGHVASVAVDRDDHVFLLHRPHIVPEGIARARRRRSSNWMPTASSFMAGADRTRVRLARQRARDCRRLQGQRLDRGQRAGRTVADRPSDDMLLKFMIRESSCCRSAAARAAATRTRRTSTSRLTCSSMRRRTKRSSPTATATAASPCFDANTGAFKRMWGAFGNAPVDPPPPAARGAAA